MLALLALAPPRAEAQQAATVLGRTEDDAGAPVAGVAVTLLGADGAFRRTVLSDVQGEYRLLAVPPGRYRLRADRLGYRAPPARELTLAPGERRRVDLRLAVDTVLIEGLVVEGRRDRERERARFESEPGITARVVEGAALKTLPGLAEADVLRAVELLPGVVSTSDFSSAFNVRGGSADQNLILLDGFPIFNPFHLGGVFSVFNADAIARAELLAGGFGAEYGGRVSSVLNVESEAGEADRLEGRAGVSMLASRLLLRAPLPDALAPGGRWFLSARRSYFDVLLRPVVDFPYHLTDLQSYLTMPTRGGGRVSVTGYTGSDVLDLSDFQPPGAAEDSSSFLRVRWDWGNRVAGVRWVQPLAGGWTSDTRLGYSRFAESLGFTDFGDVRFRSGIEQLLLRGEFARDLPSGLSARAGGSIERMAYDNLGEAGGTTFFANAGSGVLGTAFASVRWQPDPRWLVEPGLRVDAWSSDGAQHLIPSPRFAVKRFLGEERDVAVKLALGRYSQFIHSLRNEELPISNDTWVLAGRDVPAVVSDQVQTGVEAYWGEGWSASAEAYYRSFRGVTELNLADDPNDDADDLLEGTGRSYGVDFLLRSNSGNPTGWATVSLLRAERTLPNPLAAGWEDLSPTSTFAPVFDRRLDVDLVLQYRLPWDLELGARWNYGSPLPYTRPVAQHFGWRHNPIWGQYEPIDRFEGEPPLFVVPGSRNAQRYPPYHRLDATLRRTFERRWGSWTPYLQVLNVYNRKNVLFYFYNYDRRPPTRSGLSMFPVLPAVGVEVSF